MTCRKYGTGSGGIRNERAGVDESNLTHGRVGGTMSSTALNTGTVVSLRGSVVDVRFETRLPPVYSVLRG